MNRLKNVILRVVAGVSTAILRFPFTVLCLASAATILCYMISLHNAPPLWVEKCLFTLVVGALLGMVAQFSLERFDHLSKRLVLVYGFSALFTAGYLSIIWPAPEISNEITVRTLVSVFAMVCAVLWVPAFRGKADFNKIALVHFKSFFTSVLYSVVIFGGVSAILFAIDRLLFSINVDAYAYSAVIIWVVFAPVYYLSLLPNFNPKTEAQEKLAQQKSQYARFLEILASYIAIPLFAVYTLVLLAYIVKIILTRVWPIGLLGPMVLFYSAIGIVLFVLASLPENRFASLFRTFFPKVWIPIIIMQMISVSIRLNAYGITESRYYVTLFAIFSLISAIVLSISPVKKNQNIALLAAAFSLFSILPPVDAFTISRNSQIDRLEGYLTAEGMLTNGELTPKFNASEKTKIEVTNTLNYLEYQHSLDYISWLPDDFESWRNMKDTFGFEQTWPSHSGEEPSQYLYVSLDTGKAVDISGYDVSILASSYRNMGSNYKTPESTTKYEFATNGIGYILSVERTSNFDVSIVLRNDASQVLVQANLQDYLEPIQSISNAQKELLAPELMTFLATQNEYQLKIIFQNINATLSGSEAGADYSSYILIKVPQTTAAQ